MGLDTSHGCWNGPYSAFMRWRVGLHALIAEERQAQEGWEKMRFGDPYETLQQAWEAGLYNDLSEPLNILMGHSDCDGEIAAVDCGPIADALEDLMQRRMPARAMYDVLRPATERFIAGLRRAATAGEDVLFR